MYVIVIFAVWQSMREQLMEPQNDEAGLQDGAYSRIWLVKPDPSVNLLESPIACSRLS
jgi:hypothetical protein